MVVEDWNWNLRNSQDSTHGRARARKKGSEGDATRRNNKTFAEWIIIIKAPQMAQQLNACVGLLLCPANRSSHTQARPWAIRRQETALAFPVLYADEVIGSSGGV